MGLVECNTNHFLSKNPNIMKVKLIAALYLIVQAHSFLTAQSLMPNAGGQSILNDVQISWSLGETHVESIHAPDGLLTEGFHQPILQSIPIDQQASLKLQVFPNPVLGQLKIHTESIDQVAGKMHALIIDQNGSGLSRVPLVFSKGISVMEWGDTAIRHIFSTRITEHQSHNQSNAFQNHQGELAIK